jgi:hypothetical protein
MHVPTSYNMHGVFEPSDIDEMSRELKRGDVVGESRADRELRATAIIQRRMMPDISYRASATETRAPPEQRRGNQERPRKRSSNRDCCLIVPTETTKNPAGRSQRGRVK